MLLTSNVPSSLILFIFLTGTLSSTETSVLTVATQRTFPEDGIILI
jgi:hypothetical protein